VTLANQLGIPDFQRGLVWGDDLVGRLLESLYLGTPCGNVILWQASRDTRTGCVPLLPGGASRLLLIDGQQRVRSLSSVFGPARTQAARRWHVYLTKVPETASLYPGDHRPGMFRLLERPTKAPNVVLLDELAGTRPLQEVLGEQGLKVPGADEQVLTRLQLVRARLRQMSAAQLFAVTLLSEYSEPVNANETACC
jgi:hypothetical protein